ncbi:hypothetical protein Ancab_016982 [Ancistrocladus abbreviatus]
MFEMGTNKKEELWKASLGDYDVWPMGGRLVLIKRLGDVNLDNIESGQIGKLARWFDSIRPWTQSNVGLGRIVWIRCLDVDMKERIRQDVAKFSILTPVLSHISLTMRLMVDEDEFPIFITKEGTTTSEKLRIIASTCKGISNESSEAFPLPYFLERGIRDYRGGHYYRKVAFCSLPLGI